MTKNNFSLCFLLRRLKNYVIGILPVYMRVTVDGLAKEFNFGKHCEPKRWHVKANLMDGNTDDARVLDSYLNAIENKLDNAQTIFSNRVSRSQPNPLKINI